MCIHVCAIAITAANNEMFLFTLSFELKNCGTFFFLKHRENSCCYILDYPFNSVVQGLRRSYTIALSLY